MNNQLFHIMNHWALEKTAKTSKLKFTLMTTAKSIFASPVFTMAKRFFPPSGKNLSTLAGCHCCHPTNTESKQ